MRVLFVLYWDHAKDDEPTLGFTRNSCRVSEAKQWRLFVLLYLVVIAWTYVALMMGIAEATNTTGTVLGGIFTFVLYGAAPVALVVYLWGAPLRRRAIKAREASEETASSASSAASVEPNVSDQPDASGHASADTLAPVRKEP